MPRPRQGPRRRISPVLPILPAILSLLAALATAPAGHAAESSSAKAVDRAREALSEGKAEKALDQAKRALDLAETDGERASAWEMAGLVRLRTSTHHEAEWQLLGNRRKRGDRSAPGRKETELNAAWRQELDRAEEAFERALLLDDGAELHRHLVQIHFRRGDLAAARRELAKAGDAPGDEELAACLETLEGHDVLLSPDAPSLVGPERLESDPPRFPLGLRSAVAVIRAVVSEHGEVVCVQRMIDDVAQVGEAVAEAVRSWRFEPATRGGRPVPVRYYVTIKYLRN